MTKAKTGSGPSSKNKIGLSLSGGGYRAAAYHLGTLKALHKMKLLEKINVISTISGGSITGAFYCLHEGSFEDFEKDLREALGKSVIRGVLFSRTFLFTIAIVLAAFGSSIWLLFTDYARISFVMLVIFLVLFFKFQFRLIPVSRIVEEMYNTIFYRNKKLKDLRADKPQLVMGSTNLDTARPFVFSKIKLGDSFYERKKGKDEKSVPVFRPDDFPVAKAVMASSCVPFAFTPIRIEDKYYIDPVNDPAKYKPCLVDGGVYDNQGIHTITQEKSRFLCGTVITSDAGSVFSGATVYTNTISLVARTCDIFMQRIKNIQLIDNVFKNASGKGREIAYFSLGWDMNDSIAKFTRKIKEGNVPATTIEAHGIPAELLSADFKEEEILQVLETRTGFKNIIQISEKETELARTVGTNLTALSPAEIDALVGHAQAMAELQIKLHCPQLCAGNEIC